MISDLISPSQTAFIKHISIGKNILLAQEMLRKIFRNRASKDFCLKVGIHKAFDKVRWDYIFKTLRILNSPPSWILWIGECLRSTRYSILLNGAPEGFSSFCGLRQGDLVSPYIYILVMETLSTELDKTVSSKLFRVVKQKGEYQINHLEPILVNFANSTGLCMNTEKSKLYACNRANDILTWCQMIS